MFAQNLARIAAKISQRVVLADATAAAAWVGAARAKRNVMTRGTGNECIIAVVCVVTQSVQPARGGATATCVVAMRTPPRARPIQYSAG